MHDDASEIRQTLLTLRRATGLPVAFGGAVDRPGSLQLTELLGTTTGALRGLGIRPGSGLGGKVLAQGRPMWVNDYPNAATISHDYDGPVAAEGLLSVLAVPVVVRRKVRAVLYGALRTPLGLGDRTIVAAVDAARELEQDLAVRDEARRTLADLELERAAPGGPPGGAGHVEAARWEEIRYLHAELRALAERVTDQALKGRLLDACARLAVTASSGGAALPAGPALSPREVDVLACVSIGYTNAAAADQLGILPETVKSYLRSAMRKLGSHTRLEAVAAARRAGMLP